MSKYIDFYLIGELVDSHGNVHYEDLKNLPTADVVEVVRCKDCKWYVDDGMYCANDIIVQFDHFYCYNGERKEDERNI